MGAARTEKQANARHGRTATGHAARQSPRPALIYLYLAVTGTLPPERGDLNVRMSRVPEREISCLWRVVVRVMKRINKHERKYVTQTDVWR